MAFVLLEFRDENTPRRVSNTNFVYQTLEYFFKVVH